MRKCMKNFNFKLDCNEIDRIIEEQEDAAGAALAEDCDEEQETSQVVTGKKQNPP